MKSSQGVSLIIAVFAMMLLAVLGATMAMMISGNFEMNTSNLESEKSLYLADAGIQEALMHLSLGDTSFDNDTDSLYRKLSNGEYNVSRQSFDPYVNITSRGYIPNEANYRAMREIKVMMTMSGGGLTKGIGCSGLFDWSAARAHTVTIDADISAAQYNGDGDATYNELNFDYGASPLLPPGFGARDIGNGGSAIPMQDYYRDADCVWPNPSGRVITGTTDNSITTGNVVFVNSVGFFTDMVGQAVRNVGVGHAPLADGSWLDADWGVITAVSDSNRQATIDGLSRGITWRSDAIRLVRRYSSSSDSVPAPPAEAGDNDEGIGSGINYIGTNGGPVVDTVIDLRSKPLSWEDVKIICEGDIFIKGPQKLEMTHSPSGGAGSRMHPPLATQDGNIICLDATTANNREISGLIFSGTGTVRWNYLKYPTSGGAAWLRGNMIYGQNIILGGDISMKWLTALTPPNEGQFGATETSGSFSWQEQ